MQTPVLSRKQQSSSLSAKKTKVKEVIKNVLASPYSNSYWPRMSPEDHKMLKEVLEKNLPYIQKKTIPWNIMKKIPKPDRKDFRKIYLNLPDESKKPAGDKKELCIGINDISKLLENNLAAVVLISSDVQPRIMVQHIIDQCVLYKVPLLVFDELRSFLKLCAGISSTALAISKLCSNPKLNLVKENIESIYEKCPPPVDHINYNRSLENDMIIVENIVEKNEAQPIQNQTDDDKGVYLERNSKEERKFKPPSKHPATLKTSCNIEVDSANFIVLSQEQKPEVIGKKRHYKSLIVKRLKGDPDRNKRKISSLKMKKKLKK